MVASTIGTAPRRPAHEMNVRSRHGNRNGAAEIATDANRPTTVTATPITSATSTSFSSKSPGDASSPSITNNPICASQAIPSTNDRVAIRCGNSARPSTSDVTYTAANPDTWSRTEPPAYEMNATESTASGY